MKTKEEILAEVDRLLVELEEGSGEYDGEGVDGFRNLHEWNGEMLDWERTKQNVKDYIEVLKYAIVKVKNWKVVDRMLYPVPWWVATPACDDPLTYAAKQLSELEGGSHEGKNEV